MKNVKCCFCGKKLKSIKEYNNPWPASKDPSECCCHDCNLTFVIPLRLAKLKAEMCKENLINEVENHDTSH